MVSVKKFKINLKPDMMKFNQPTSADFLNDNLDAIKLKRIKKKSERINTVANEKNKIEEKRLTYLTNLIRKQQANNNNKLMIQYGQMKNELNIINKRTNDKLPQNSSDSELSDSGDSVKPPNTAVSFVRSEYLSVPNTANRSSISLYETAFTQSSYRTSNFSSLFTDKKGQSSSQCLYLKPATSGQNYMSNGTNTPQPHNETCNHQQSLNNGSTKSYEIRKSSCCSLFPCAQLKSYTSIVGEKNDRRIKTAPAKIAHDGTVYHNPFEGNFSKTEFEISQEVTMEFNNNHSIRRPLRNIGSSKDFEFKINAVEKQAKFCKEQNYQNLKPSDRNVRYGGPLPRKNLYRQLRIIAKFDN